MTVRQRRCPIPSPDSVIPDMPTQPTITYPSQHALELAQRVLVARGVKRAPYLQRRLARAIDEQGDQLAARLIREATTVARQA